MPERLTGADLKADLAKAEKELQSLQERVAILKDWIAVTRKICGRRASVIEGENTLSFLPHRRRTKATELAKHVTEVLRNMGRPMHVNLIAIELQRKGHPVNAKNPYATLAVALSRRPEEFKRVGPNQFDLVKKEEEQAVG